MVNAHSRHSKRVADGTMNNPTRDIASVDELV